MKLKRAGKADYGLAKISDAADITTDDGLVLGSKEKNPALPNTLARDISSVRSLINSQISGINATVITNSNTGSVTITEGYKDIECCKLTNLQPGFYLVYSHVWVSHYQYAVASDMFLNNSLLCVLTFPGGSDNRYWCRIVGISTCSIASASDVLRANLNVGIPAGTSVPGSCMITAIRLKK